MATLLKKLKVVMQIYINYSMISPKPPKKAHWDSPVSFLQEILKLYKAYNN